MSRFFNVTSAVLKVVLPLVTVGGSLGMAYWLVVTKPDPPKKLTEVVIPSVEAARVENRPVCFSIRSQGTVLPRTESTLVARVSGRIVEVADSFDESGFFNEGDELVKIERRDYQVRIDRLNASLTAAKAQFEEADSYFKRLKGLLEREQDIASEVEFEKSLSAHKVAEARLAELDAQLAEAENALEDTTIVAPFDGCIRQKQADLGQFVVAGTPLATCFATDAVDVRLPVDDQDFAFLGLPLGETLPEDSGPTVTLEAHFGGKICRWNGTIIRTEAFVDARSRMAYLVARVREPYKRRTACNGQPLAVGMFVEAAIRCPPIDDAVVLPESCVSHEDKLFLVDTEGVLKQQEVQVVRREREWVLVRGDLNTGQYVCATRLEYAEDGTKVKIGKEKELEAGRIEGGGLVVLAADTVFATRSPDETAVRE
jgi:RND family efflux transporter MFP subunit